MAMNQIGIINGIFVLLFIALTTFSSLAQQPKEPFQQVWERASMAMRQKEYDAAVLLYTEAINLFPEIDAYTPKNEKLNSSKGKFIETPYTGLQALYLGRAKAYSNKGNLEEAENDYSNAFNVIRSKITKRLNEAKSERGRVNIKKEKKSAYHRVDDSNLFRAARHFMNVLQICEEAKYVNYQRERDYWELRIKLLPSEQNVIGFDDVAIYKKEAFFGQAEALATLLIEVGTKEHSFITLKSANELVAAFPSNIEAYWLRAKVNRQLGRDEFALADEQKVKELSGQK